jgi:predicted permease
VGRRIFSLLLRCYPASFRSRYGADLVDAFNRDRDRPEFSGFTGSLRLWRHVVGDVARTSWSERVERRAASSRAGFSPAAAITEVRQIARGLARRPAFTLVAILTLGLGVGAATTVFAVIDRVLLTPLPYPDADRLVRVYELERENADAQMVAYGNYADLVSQTDAFEHLAIWAYNSHALTGDGPARQLGTRETSANFGLTMGVRPQRGRWFNDDEARQSVPVIVISHSLWQEAFGGLDTAVGRALQLDAAPYEIVGVMPEGFDYPSRADAWIPLAPVADPVASRRRHRHNMVGRLRVGVTPAAAREQMDVVAARLEQAFPDLNKGNYFEPRLLLDDVVANRRASLVVLAGAVTALLLIACVNIASLTLAHAVSRTRDLALRAALGASTRRLAWLVTIEMTLLAAAGSAVGLVCSTLGVRAVLDLGGTAIPRADEVAAISGRVFLFAVGVSLMCALAVSLLPILRSRRLTTMETAEALRGGRSSATRSVVQGRRVLVGAQLTLAFVLAVGAGLFLESYSKLQAVETGVDATGVLTMNVQLPGAKYPERAQVARFMDDLTGRLEAIPGIERAGVTLTPPVNANGWYNSLTIRDRPVPRADLPPISYVVAGAGYLETLRVPLIMGRFYDPGEPRGELVAVINEAAAERHWPGEDPIGRQILGSADDEASWARVVGVVGNIRQDLTREAAPEVYVPVAQDRVLGFVVVARVTSGDPMSLSRVVEEAIGRAEPDAPVTHPMSLDERIGQNVAQPRFTAALVSMLAALAVLLAAAGVFGVVSYTVAQRRREFGIRIAMGATRSRVAGQVLREGLAVAGVAVLAGAVISRLIGGAVSDMLFGVTPADPAVYLLVGLTILVVAAAAGLGPARRAMAADPLSVLRDD